MRADAVGKEFGLMKSAYESTKTELEDAKAEIENKVVELETLKRGIELIASQAGISEE